MTNVRSILLASAAGFAAWLSDGRRPPTRLLTGAITSASGEKLGGVTVSAKLDGSTITTSVYTDETGNYYFPPLPAGKYQVWAQALGFETAKGAVDLNATKHQNLALKAMTDQEQHDPPAAERTAGRGAARGDRGRRAHQEGLHQPVHRLPCARLSAAVQVRRGRLEQDHQPDEGRARTPASIRPIAKANAIIEHQPEGARGLSRARARPGRNLDEVHAASAPDRRSRPRRLDAL